MLYTVVVFLLVSKVLVVILLVDIVVFLFVENVVVVDL